MRTGGRSKLKSHRTNRVSIFKRMIQQPSTFTFTVIDYNYYLIQSVIIKNIFVFKNNSESEFIQTFTGLKTKGMPDKRIMTDVLKQTRYINIFI